MVPGQSLPFPLVAGMAQLDCFLLAILIILPAYIGHGLPPVVCWRSQEIAAGIETGSSPNASLSRGSALLKGTDPYANHAWRQRLPVNLESEQFPAEFLLSSLSEIVVWSPASFLFRTNHRSQSEEHNGNEIFKTRRENTSVHNCWNLSHLFNSVSGSWKARNFSSFFTSMHK